MDKSGLVLHLQRLSTEDGPGIRTTVFFKGCPLRCAWCHNPESLLFKPQVQWLEERCIGCETCLQSCPNACLHKDSSGIHIDRQRCKGCGTCSQNCPTNAMELLGQRCTVSELLAELAKDRAYYEKSGGGVTLSGGEPTFQATFALELLHNLNNANIHTALDTCGLCSQRVLERLLQFVDLVLFDIKFIDTSLHHKFTGQENGIILANLQKTADWARSDTDHKKLWVRTPLIPQATLKPQNIQAIGHFIASKLGKAVDRWELCAFNNLCRDKYRRLGIEWPHRDTPLIRQSTLNQVEAWAKNSGVRPEIVSVTGAARVE